MSETMKLLLLGVCIFCVTGVQCEIQSSSDMDTTMVTAPTTMPTTTVVTSEASTTTEAPTTTATTKPTTTATTKPTTTATTKPITTETTKAPSSTTGTTGIPPTHQTKSPINPPTGTWIVKDNQGGICMKMEFGARLYVAFTNTSNDMDIAVVDVPPTALSESSMCTDEGPRQFILHLYNDAEYWYLNFTFDIKTKYSLTEVGIAVTYDDVHIKNPKDKYARIYEYTTDVNFLNSSVPLGKSFTCSKGLTFQTSSTTITMVDLKLQPFADEADGDFGKSMECSNPSSTNKALVIGVSVGVCVFAGIVVAFVVFVVIKQRRSQSEDMRPLGVK